MWANEGGGANRRGGRDTTMSAAVGKGAAAMKDRTISMLNDLVEEKELSKEDSKRVAALAQLVVYLLFLAFLMVCVFLPGYSRMMYRATFSIENQFYGSDLCASPRTAPRAAPSRVQRGRVREERLVWRGWGGSAEALHAYTRWGGRKRGKFDLREATAVQLKGGLRTVRGRTGWGFVPSLRVGNELIFAFALSPLSALSALRCAFRGACGGGVGTRVVIVSGRLRTGGQRIL